MAKNIDMETYRIGNILKQGVIDLHESRLLEIDQFLQWDVLIRCNASYAPNPEPEPLTADWLHNLGLYKTSNEFLLEHPFWKFRGIELLFEADGKFYVSFNRFNREIRYVHEVQNLYSAITGKEIDIRKFL